MKVQVLDEATADLADGFRFYEQQANGPTDISHNQRGQISNY